MGNSKSSSSGDPSLLSYSQNVEENEYIPIKSSRNKHHHSSLDKLHFTSTTTTREEPPPLPAQPAVVMRTKARSHTVLSAIGNSSTETYEARRKTFMESLSQSMDKGTSDSLTRRVSSIIPADGAQDVPVDCTVQVQFDKDVKTVNVNKLFEVSKIYHILL